MIMLQVTVAKAWRMKPSEFAACSEEDQAYMIALEQTNAEIAAAESFIAEKKAKESQRKSKGNPKKSRSHWQ